VFFSLKVTQLIKNCRDIYQTSSFITVLARIKHRTSSWNIYTHHWRPRGRSSSPGRAKIFLLHVVQTDSGPSQSPIQWVLGFISQGVKQPGRETDRSPPTSAEVKNTWIYRSTPPIHLRGVVLNYLSAATTLLYSPSYPVEPRKPWKPADRPLRSTREDAPTGPISNCSSSSLTWRQREEVLEERQCHSSRLREYESSVMKCASYVLVKWKCQSNELRQSCVQ
jgi:hypothetical protein